MNEITNSKTSSIEGMSEIGVIEINMVAGGIVLSAAVQQVDAIRFRTDGDRLKVWNGDIDEL